MAYKSMEALKQYHRELYRWYVDRGICFYCKKAYAEPGRTYCKKCLQRKLAMNERRDPDRVKRNSYNRERRERLKAEGLCVDCGRRPAVEGQTRCPVCAQKKRESEQVSRIRKRIEKKAMKQGG